MGTTPKVTIEQRLERIELAIGALAYTQHGVTGAARLAARHPELGHMLGLYEGALERRGTRRQEA